MFELVEVQDVVSLGTESDNFLYPRGLASFDPWHVTHKVRIREHIWAGRYNKDIYSVASQRRCRIRKSRMQNSWNSRIVKKETKISEIAIFFNVSLLNLEGKYTYNRIQYVAYPL